jgi:hypothetical protein
MFLVKNTSEFRKKKIRSFLGKDEDGPIAIVLAAIHFEWIISRAILLLSRSPTAEVKAKLAETHGLDRYKDLWKEELSKAGICKTLPNSVSDWTSIRAAMVARNRIAHGSGSATAAWARKHANALLSAADEIGKIATDRGIDLHANVSPRRRTKQQLSQ